MTDLKPCPFCGEGSHEDDREPCPDGDGWVTCGGCGARATEERWNNRPTEQAARVAGIREAAEHIERGGRVTHNKLRELMEAVQRPGERLEVLEVALKAARVAGIREAADTIDPMVYNPGALVRARLKALADRIERGEG